MTCNNIKSRNKPGLHPFSEKHIFGKITGGGGGGGSNSRRDSVNKVLHLLTNVLPRAFASWRPLLKKFLYQIHQKVDRTSTICTYYLNHPLFGYAKKCMSQLPAS